MTDEKTRALIAELRSAAGAGREGTHAGYSSLLRGADLATRAADALEALTVPGGDKVVERIRAKLDQIPDLDAVALDKADVRALLARIAVPDGDARERLIEVLRTITPRLHEPLWTNVLGDQADAILAAVPELSRDIAGEIEAEIERNEARAISDYLRGLRRAAEIVRNGR